MSSETSQYREVFFAESQEHLQCLNDGLLVLEKNPTDKEAMNTVFRSAHTIKGMAATMGFNTMAVLTHHLEDVLDKVRTGATQLSPVLSDLLFKGVDVLEDIMVATQTGSEPKLSTIDALLQEISVYSEERHLQTNQLINNQERQPKSALILEAYERVVINEARLQGYRAYFIEVRLAQDCLMKAVRAFLVFQRLEPMGEIIRSEPSVEDLEEEKFDQNFRLLFVTRLTEDEIRNLIIGISDIVDAEIKPIDFRDDSLKEEVVEQTTMGQGVKNHQLLATQTVRIDIHRLDNLMNLVGELVITKTRLDQLLLNNGSPDMEETLKSLSRVAGGLQDAVMKARMVPLSQVFNRFPRMVRDLARELGREVEFSIEGEETELDRSVIDEIGDPLVHLLRNAVDHGVESPTDREARGKSPTAHVRLVAKYEGNRVLIMVEDDGKGIHQDQILKQAEAKGLISPEQAKRLTGDEVFRLLFLPGLSSSDQVSDISGRGVGLDVVQTKIEALGGIVEISSVPNQGTRFSIKLPLTLAIIQALMIRAGGEIYALPLEAVEEIQILKTDSIRKVNGQEVMTLRGQVLPLVRLMQVLGKKEISDVTSTELPVVVVQGNGSLAGLVVDNLVGQREIVIKSLGRLFGALPGIAGATILGDGRVALILDLSGILSLAERKRGNCLS